MSAAEQTLRNVAALAYSQLTPSQKRRYGCWVGLRKRVQNGRVTYRAAIKDSRLNAGRAVYVGETPSYDTAAILYDIARLALGRTLKNFPRDMLAGCSLPVFDDVWLFVLSRLYRHSGTTMRAQLANTPNPFAGEPQRGPTARPITLH